MYKKKSKSMFMHKITDIDQFVETIRTFVFNKFKDPVGKIVAEDEETVLKKIDSFISFPESKLIIAEIIGDKVEISREEMIKICEAINARVLSNALRKMVLEDYLDCAFEDNNFTFSVNQKGLEKAIILPLKENQ